MTEEKAIFVLYKLKPTIPRADGKSTTHILETTALDLAIKALEQVAKLRELQKNLAEKERFYVKEPYDHTQYSNGLVDAYCTVNALIDEILGDREE